MEREIAAIWPLSGREGGGSALVQFILCKEVKMPSRKVALGAALVVSALASGAVPAQSAVLTLGGGWEPFYYVNPTYPSPYGGPIHDYYSGDTDFTFTVTSHADLNITDAYYNLDMFDLVVTGPGGTVDEGPTSYVLGKPYDFTEDFDVAFADPNFSHGSYRVGPGTYDVTGTAIFSPYGYGIGGIEVAVPEPAAWALMLIGFGVVGALARRRARPGSAMA